MKEQEIAKLLSLHEVHPTQQRIAVYQFLLTHPIHPSADTIYNALSEKFPVLSRTTIYNSLNSLLEAGLIRCVTILSDEQRFDATVSDHGHFLCKKCGRVLDFDVNSEVLYSLCPAGYESTQGDVYFTGLCPQCLKDSKK